MLGSFAQGAGGCSDAGHIGVCDVHRVQRLGRTPDFTNHSLEVGTQDFLDQHSGRRFAIFEELFQPEHGPEVMVVTFIALLELAREHLIEVTQAEAFAPIYVRLAYQVS